MQKPAHLHDIRVQIYSHPISSYPKFLVVTDHRTSINLGSWYSFKVIPKVLGLGKIHIESPEKYGFQSCVLFQCENIVQLLIHLNGLCQTDHGVFVNCTSSCPIIQNHNVKIAPYFCSPIIRVYTCDKSEVRLSVEVLTLVFTDTLLPNKLRMIHVYTF